jgi:putative transposase
VISSKLACGHRFRILNIVDEVTRQCFGGIPDTSMSGRPDDTRAHDLDRGPRRAEMIVSDDGAEFDLQWS